MGRKDYIYGKVKFYSNLLKLNLQRFADEGQDGEGGADTGNEATDTNDDSDTQNKPFMTFQTQSELILILIRN